jgi:hypothetical protein
VEYQEAVQEARQLVRRSEADQWRLAQLTYEQVEAGKTRKQWAKDIGISETHAQDLYKTYARFGEKGSSPFGQNGQYTFAEAYAMAREGVATPEDARRSTDEHQAISAVRKMTPERKAQVVREALADPDVAVRTLRDSHTRRIVSDAREQVAQEIEDTAKARQDASPVQREVAQTSLRFEIGHLLRVGRFKIAEAAKLLVDLADRDEDTYEDDLQDIQDALDWFKAILRGGKVDDEALTKLLEGGSS